MLQRLNHLPRETRDTLFLLAVIAWIIAPLTSHLPLWCSAMAAGILLWRGRIALSGAALPARWWLMGLLLLATGATFYSHKTILGRDAGVTFIVVLLALKTLELRAQRDAFVIFFLGFFTMLSNFFVSQSLLTAASMLLALLGLLTALVNSHMPVGRPSLLHAAKIAGWMALLGAPIMVVLFMLFPRLAPLWGTPNDSLSAHSGLSASMQVGAIARLALDSSVAMRIKFNDRPPAQNALYFRGPVLASFDGREWQPLNSVLPAQRQPAPQLVVEGPPVRYEVTLEGHNRPWLLALDATPEAPQLGGYRATMGNTLQWSADRPITDLVRYRATSYPRFRHGPLQRELGLQEYLLLPDGFNPHTRQLAEQIRNTTRHAAGDSLPLVQAALERLRTGGYSYTLEPGVFGTDTADEFWFDRKEGFCEHIASAFVLLMRAMDVPARVVTGYQGGDINPIDGFFTVRQSDAHAWTEVWIAGQGWLRVDPTSAVAPGRTGSFQRLEAPQSIFSRALVTVNPSFALNLRALWEAANNRWNQWVLNYSQTRQLDLLSKLGFESPSWEDLGLVLACIVALVGLAGAAWTQWERQRQDPWLRLMQRARAALQRAGVPVPPNALPRQLVGLLQTRYPADKHPQTPLISDWILRLEAWRYSAQHAAEKRPAAAHKLVQLQREFAQLPWPVQQQKMPGNPPLRPLKSP